MQNQYVPHTADNTSVRNKHFLSAEKTPPGSLCRQLSVCLLVWYHLADGSHEAAQTLFRLHSVLFILGRVLHRVRYVKETSQLNKIRVEIQLTVDASGYTWEGLRDKTKTREEEKRVKTSSHRFTATTETADGKSPSKRFDSN